MNDVNSLIPVEITEFISCWTSVLLPNSATALVGDAFIVRMMGSVVYKYHPGLHIKLQYLANPFHKTDIVPQHNML